MQKILIVGSNSYIGNSFEKWLKFQGSEYNIKKISVRDEKWKEQDFSNYDVVLHVAGIAHRKSNKNNMNLYYEVNRNLSYEVARKAKNEGVSLFIFISTMSVYGIDTGEIDENSIPDPKSHYGKSKLQAEKLIDPLKSMKFKVAIIRPPMVYGKECKGNYKKFSKLARKLPIFPEFNNKRSVLFIENLCEFMKVVIDDKKSGLYMPQNKEYISTNEMIKIIRKAHGKKTYLTKFFNPIIGVFIKRSVIIGKLFGNLVYKKNLSAFENNYQIENTKESIIKSEE